MKKQIEIAIELTVLLLSFYGCSHSISGPEKEYTELEYAKLFSEPIDSIAVVIAKALDADPIAFDKIIPRPKPAQRVQIKEGYQYLASDSAKLVIWTDSTDSPLGINYDSSEDENANEFAFEKSGADSFLVSTLKKIGIELSKDTKFHSGQFNYFFDIQVYQKYQNTELNPWQIDAEIAGDTTRITLLTIYRWYLNLAEIRQTISDAELKNAAFNYLISSGDSLDYESLEDDGFYLIKDKLCKLFFYWIYDGIPALKVRVYIDIQDGEIVFKDLFRFPR